MFLRQASRLVTPRTVAAARGLATLPPGYVADPAQPPLLRYQASLPRLPVPTLESTCTKYLDTVKPHLTPSAFQKTQKSVTDFLASPFAHELQKRLQSRAANPDTLNWISDWWNEAAYMGYRDPVVVFVSYFYVHVDDPLRRDPAKRAGALVKATLAFRELVESGRLEPEKVKGAPLCMASYKWLFHATRYPVKPVDTAAKFDPKSNNHVVVLRKNRFYVVPLGDVKTGREYSAVELEAMFNNIIAHAGEKAVASPVGALTGDNRDLWADAREALLEASPERNAEVLRTIDGAMMIIALDDFNPITREDISWQTWVGNGRNRWYDKQQMIVYDNGRSGFLGEHSCMDGTTTLRMNEFVLASIASGKADLGPDSYDASSLPGVHELVFELNDKVKGLIKDSEKRFDELVGKHDLHVLHYEGFGKRFTKHHKTSPDAAAQLIKQLAFHKMHSRPAVTYESAQTRKFQLGRTEVIRSSSSEAKEWAEAMLVPHAIQKDPLYLKGLFDKAAKRHITYAGWAADGQGVDRHLFGLKKLLREGEEAPALFKDEAYAKTSHWELSTSQLSSPFFDGWGYGEVVPDGYGLAYAIGDDYIRWTITSLKMQTDVLKHYLAEAATEVKMMLEAAEKKEKELQAAREKVQGGKL